MAYNTDMAQAARRNWAAAEKLYEDPHAAGAKPGNLAVAGYLYGLAGEMALKKLIADSQVLAHQELERGLDPMWLHFPDLVRAISVALAGRRAHGLSTILSRPIFSTWAIKMRYGRTSDVQIHWINTWRDNAREVIGYI